MGLNDEQGTGKGAVAVCLKRFAVFNWINICSHRQQVGAVVWPPELRFCEHGDERAYIFGWVTAVSVQSISHIHLLLMVAPLLWRYAGSGPKWNCIRLKQITSFCLRRQPTQNCDCTGVKLGLSPWGRVMKGKFGPQG